MFRYAISASLLCLTIAPMPVLAAQNQEQAASAVSERVAGYHADLRELSARIKIEHPRPFRTLTEAAFDALVDEEIAGINEASTRADFLWAMTHVIASIGCGHSQLPQFNQQNSEIAPEDRFPIDVRFHDGRLYVTHPKNNLEVLWPGQEIVQINGQPVSEIRNSIFSRIPADAHLPTSKELMANVWLTSYLTYALGFPEAYDVVMRGSTDPITLTPLSEWKFEPILSPRDPCQEELCYERDEERNLGIATLHRLDFYGGDRGNQFVAWWAEVMDDLKANKRDGLLIDMRGILGGSGNAGSYMLRHLTSEGFAYYSENSDPRGRESLFLEQQPIGDGFDGEVFILMDGLTYSAAPHIFAIAQANGIATLVGTQAGGGKSTNDGKVPFTSTHEGVEYLVSRMIFEVDAPQLGPTEPVQPDITLAYSLEDTLERTDSMRERAVELLGLRASQRAAQRKAN